MGRVSVTIKAIHSFLSSTDQVPLVILSLLESVAFD